MSYLEQQMKFLKFDKRLMEIYLKNGSLTEQEYKEYLTTLDDCSHKAEGWTLDSDRNAKKSPEPINQDSFPEDVGDTEDASAHIPQSGTVKEDAEDASINRDPLGSGY